MAEAVYTRVIPVGTESSYWALGADYMQAHLEIPAFFSVLYLAVIFLGPRFMAQREKPNVKWLSIIWNGLLAVFSILGAYFYTFGTLLPALLKKSFTTEICTLDSEFATPWVFLFCLSKIPELFDTALHVVKKQQFIFLHWYHHVTVMWFCWFAWAYSIENGGLFAAMNLVVHSIMYTFYTLGAAGARFPTAVMVFITLLQIIQMVLGTAIVAANILHCNDHPYIQIAGLIMYLSYGLLFIHFFINKYFGSGSEKKSSEHHKSNGKKVD